MGPQSRHRRGEAAGTAAGRRARHRAPTQTDVAMLHHAPALRVYRGLLWLYPAEFRDHFEREMCRTLADLLRERPSAAAILPLYLGVLIDAPKEHYHMIRQ